jgi:hypothetical protein
MKMEINFYAVKMRFFTAFSLNNMIFTENSCGYFQRLVLYFIRITITLYMNYLAIVAFLW